MTYINIAMVRPILAVMAIVALAVYSTPSSSETSGSPHTHHTMDHSQMNHDATDLYAPAMKAMHENMTIAPTGDADIDFMRGMIPHHQGAIDMAKIVLAHGKDSEVKKLAEDVIRAQESEIAFMREWLAKNVK
jgi:uncharacterized protein (DUF305 family)